MSSCCSASLELFKSSSQLIQQQISRITHFTEIARSPVPQFGTDSGHSNNAVEEFGSSETVQSDTTSDEEEDVTCYQNSHFM